jgi:transposase
VGKVTRKRYSADFKAKVALEAIKGELPLTELAAKHGVHQTMIATWKPQAIEVMSATFSGKSEVAKAASEAEFKPVRLGVHQRVGVLLQPDRQEPAQSGADAADPSYGARQMASYEWLSSAPKRECEAAAFGWLFRSAKKIPDLHRSTLFCCTSDLF